MSEFTFRSAAPLSRCDFFDASDTSNASTAPQIDSEPLFTIPDHDPGHATPPPSLPGPSNPSLRLPPPIAFSLDTFNLADLADSKALERLKNPQLRLKYDVNTARANDGMVANLRQHDQDQ
ncbi:hypothetical protein B0H11DRAFT_2226823 [Mycena galericulata]|nr:hypothetical protein B0H11DRAFT_2226823 [Mycena galericulata]